MKKQLVFLTLLTSIVISCANNPDTAGNMQKPDTTSAQKSSDETDETLCYSYEAGGSKAIMQLRQIDDSLVGSLEYNLKEKDLNKGTFTGIIKGELLEGYYTFQSEGQTSVRQEVFRWQGDDLVVGTGEVVQKNDTVLFRNVDKLNFKTSITFKKTNCK